MSKRTKPTIAKNDPVFKNDQGQWFYTAPGSGDQAFGPYGNRNEARAARTAHKNGALAKAYGATPETVARLESAAPATAKPTPEQITEVLVNAGFEKPLDPAPTPVVVSETSAPVHFMSQEIPMAVLKLVRTNKIGVSLYAPEGGKVCASFPKSLFAGDPPAEIQVQDGILQAVKVGGGGAKASDETKAKAAANAEKAVARAKAAQERAEKAMARAKKLGVVPAEPTATDAPGQ